MKYTCGSDRAPFIVQRNALRTNQNPERELDRPIGLTLEKINRSPAFTLALSSYDRVEYRLIQQQDSDSEGEDTRRRSRSRREISLRVKSRSDRMNLSIQNRPLIRAAYLSVAVSFIKNPGIKVNLRTVLADRSDHGDNNYSLGWTL